MIIKNFTSLIKIAVAVGVLAVTSLAPCQTVDSARVVPGVSWENFVVEDGPLNYNIIRVNVTDPRVTLETEAGHDQLFRGEKVLAAVKRETIDDDGYVVAGINADFWAGGGRYIPVGFLVADGMIYRMPHAKRSAFVFTEDEKSYIGPVTLEVAIGKGDKSLSIRTINPSEEVNVVSLFTPPYGKTVPAQKGTRYLLSMKGMEFLPNKPVQVRAVEVSSDKETPVSPGTLVLHVPESQESEARALLADGEEFTVIARLPEVEGVVRSACGGGPKLVEAGKPSVQNKQEGIGESFTTARHPRTAIGFTKDQKNVFLVTVDGRQPDVSVGVNLQELAEFMATLGCWSAMNLDGGGSTTMVVDNEVVNSPSDASGPRTVVNSILVVSDLPSTATASGKSPAIPAQPAQ